MTDAVADPPRRPHGWLDCWPLEWLDDVAALAAHGLSRHRRPALVCLILATVLAGIAAVSREGGTTLANAFPVVIALGGLTAALGREIWRGELRLPVWVPAAAGLAIHVVHASSTSTTGYSIDASTVSLGVLPGLLLAAAACSGGSELPRPAVLTLVALGCAGVIDARGELDVLVVGDGLALAPALWSLGLAALFVGARQGRWLWPCVALAVCALGAPSTSEYPELDTGSALMMLTVVVCGRVVAFTARETSDDSAAAAAGRLRTAAAARPLLATVFLVIFAMAGCGIASGIHAGFDALMALQTGLVEDPSLWAVRFVSVPVCWYVALAVIAHGPLRGAGAATRVACLVAVLLVPFALFLLSSVPRAISAITAGSLEWLAALFDAGWLLAPLVVAAGLWPRRRHAVLGPLDLMLLALCVAMAPAGLMVRDVDDAWAGMRAWPWANAEVIGMFVVPVLPALLLHRLVDARPGTGRLLVAAPIGGLVAGASSVVLAAYQEYSFASIGATEAVTVAEIAVRWSLAALWIPLARVLSGRIPPPAADTSEA